MTVQPVKLSMTDKNTVAIEWSDGQRQVYGVADLRRDCPCAMCVDERGRDEASGSHSHAPSSAVTITQMSPVGNYAYKIHFSDGHNTGIYTLELLRQLGTLA